jgi:threonine/homoserine/homoserine lactone efflux protein
MVPPLQSLLRVRGSGRKKVNLADLLRRQNVNLEQALAFFVFAVVTSITPGPNNIMLTATGANVGVRRGLTHMFGVALGFALMIFVVAAGAGTALTDNPAAMQALRYVGIAVLLWLAWKIGTAGRAGPAARERPVGFLAAALFQWVNPKAWLICAGAVSGFLREDGSGALLQASLFAAIFLLAGTPCMMLWLGFGAAMQRVLKSERALRGFNISTGVLLALTVLLLI